MILKRGDKVECIRSIGCFGLLQFNRKYTVAEVLNKVLRVEEVDFQWWDATNFKLVEPVAEPKIDWSKPVRLIGSPDAKWRVLCTDAPGGAPVRVMLVEGEAAGFIPGCVFSRELDGTVYTARPEHAFENVPPEPVTKTMEIVLQRRTRDGHVSVTTKAASIQPEKQGCVTIIGRKTVTVTEGEGL